MVIGNKIPYFITDFFETINENIREHSPGNTLSSKQIYWLSFCVLGALITNSICWSRFAKAGLGKYKETALSWMFRHSKIPWHLLFQVSVRVNLSKYGIVTGTLNVDETDNKRSKRTKRISWVHKLKDKATGGYAMGQCLVFLVLVTPTITIPVGFKFYMPDPDVSQWKKNDDKLIGKTWRLTTKVDSRIEPFIVGTKRFLIDDYSPLLEIVRQEGIEITA